MSRKAESKKLQKQFKVGDRVTWGNGSRSHLVVAILANGVVVDVSSEEHARHFAVKQPDGRYFLLVTFTKNNRNKSGRGPIRHA